MDERDIRFFDKADEFWTFDRRLPHWSQSGTVCFITFRTADSLPKAVIQQWLDDRRDMLREHGIDSSLENWRNEFDRLPASLKNRINNRLSEKWHDNLDNCHGACVLRQPDYAKIVADSFLHFDEQRYLLTDFIVMPNHTHLLAAFADEDSMLLQCESWKHFTATRLNRLLGQQGRFWQQDDFDHLVRSAEQFEYFRRYIAENPSKAGLKPGEFIHYSRVLVK